MKQVDFKYCKEKITVMHWLVISRTIMGKYKLTAYDPFGWRIFTIYKGRSKMKAKILKRYFDCYIWELQCKIDEE